MTLNIDELFSRIFETSTYAKAIVETQLPPPTHAESFFATRSGPLLESKHRFFAQFPRILLP